MPGYVHRTHSNGVRRKMRTPGQAWGRSSSSNLGSVTKRLEIEIGMQEQVVAAAAAPSTRPALRPIAAGSGELSIHIAYGFVQCPVPPDEAGRKAIAVGAAANDAVADPGLLHLCVAQPQLRAR